jgi:molybdopterin-guanine dinucleotide biosynthesis protein A
MMLGMAAASVSGVLLAGGRSRRMARDKRLLMVDGEPMIRRAAAAVAEVSDELIVVLAADDASELPLAGLGARLARDRISDAGPMAGLEAGLDAANHEVALVAAADMPWMEAALLRLLGERLSGAPDDVDAVVLPTDRGPQPMPAAYRRRIRTRVTAMLDSGERRMGALLAALAVEALTPDEWRRLDPPGRSILNVNHPADLPRSA